MTESTNETLPWLIQGGMGIAISGWALARAARAWGDRASYLERPLTACLFDDFKTTASTPSCKVPSIASHYKVSSTTLWHLWLSSANGFDAVSQRADVDPWQHRSIHRRGRVGIIRRSNTRENGPSRCGRDQPSYEGPALNRPSTVRRDSRWCRLRHDGAGVPTHIPGVLEKLALGDPVVLPHSVTGAASDNTTTSLHFDPSPYVPSHALSRPRFVGIVSSHVLATALAKRSNGPVDGFVVERPSAGGHNAPPRGSFEVDGEGNPHYGERDVVDFDAMASLGKPFWIGGGITSAQHVSDAVALGARGVQVGTLFAYCNESGMDPALRRRVLDDVKKGSVIVKTSLTSLVYGLSVQSRVAGRDDL